MAEMEAAGKRREKDLKKEKSLEFEETDTYRAIRTAYEKKTGKPAPYAQVPTVTLRRRTRGVLPMMSTTLS